ncbi:MAG: hypothetical protein Q4A67_04755 [Aerococcus sp.]|nr:hypothetical protein [Aerococcus sp.]
MKTAKQMATALVALSITGLLAGCTQGTANQAPLFQTQATAETQTRQSDEALTSESTQPTKISQSTVATGEQLSATTKADATEQSAKTVSGYAMPSSSDKEETSQTSDSTALSEKIAESTTATVPVEKNSATEKTSADSDESVAVQEAKAAFNQATDSAYATGDYDVFVDQLDATTVQIEVRHDNDDGTISNMVNLYQYDTKTAQLTVMDLVSGTWHAVE